MGKLEVDNKTPKYAREILHINLSMVIPEQPNLSFLYIWQALLPLRLSLIKQSYILH
jgi:hypothetical protein